MSNWNDVENLLELSKLNSMMATDCLDTAVDELEVMSENLNNVLNLMEEVETDNNYGS